MKFIPMVGYVTDTTAADGRQQVAGFAFQIPGFEFFHTWVTPFLGRFPSPDDGWVVTHWETGLYINMRRTRAPTKEEAAKRAEAALTKIGHKKLRAKLKELGC